MADSSSRKFKFISPGVFVNEIDNSQIPDVPSDIGPVVVGIAAKGPSMTPVVVNSFSEFVEVFGNPVAGNKGTDVWRDKTGIAPTYGAYAAQAYLRNNSPLTFMRLRGDQHTDATSDGKAGWKAGALSATPSEGGGWGLVVFPSSSLVGNMGTATPSSVRYPVVTGTLAACFYLTGGRVVISGTKASGGHTTASACELYESDSSGNLTLGISSDGTITNLKNVKISLNSVNQNYTRDALNTNPAITNSTITTSETRTRAQGGAYWLGESTTNELLQSATSGIGVLGNDALSATVLGTKFHACILPLRNLASTSQTLCDRQFSAQKATTGWFISQDLGANASDYSPLNMQKLFRFEALTAGEDIQNSIKISISNIKAPEGDFQDYGSFSVLIRNMRDNDNVPVIIERYDNLNLNPASPNYIGVQIGDKYETFDATTKTNRVYGTHTNRSRWIRVVVNEDVDKAATTPTYLPFGVFGPLKYRDVSVVSGSSAFTTAGNYISASDGQDGSCFSIFDGGNVSKFGEMGGHSGSTSMVLGGFFSNSAGTTGDQGFSASIQIPSVPLRQQDSWGAPKTLKATYWGAWVGKTNLDVKFNTAVIDHLRARCSGLETNPSSTSVDVVGQTARSGSSPLEIAWVFSLDDVSGSTSAVYTYVSGSRASGTSVSAASGSYTGSLVAGLDRFTTVMHGGSDGLNVKERNPFRNALMDDTTEKTSYELFSLKKAINILADAEQTQYNVATLPGVTQALVTDHLLDVVEERGDALAVIDIDNVYTADTDSTESAADRNAFTIKQATDSLKSRNINNSYGATYYPWVKIQDTVTNRILWVPPSVAALGALSTTDRQAAPWFAPAGFARGGLTEGAAGIPVLDVSKRLTSDNRDDLYEANINPIAKFPAEGIVIFGQKTLQQTASALDRINVRRLLIYLKREISFIASRMLFMQNTRDTWNLFVGKATPILESVKSEFGIDDFRLILDETTTTPDLIDRNIIYAKLIVKPTRAVEFFAIDFVVTNSGASFED